MMDKKKLLFGIVGGVIGGVVGWKVSEPLVIFIIAIIIDFLENWIAVIGRINLLVVFGVTIYVIRTIFVILGFLTGIFFYRQLTKKSPLKN